MLGLGDAQTDFDYLQVQVVPHCEGAVDNQAVYLSSSVSVDRQGLTLRRHCDSEDASEGTTSQLEDSDASMRWVPWPSVVEASEATLARMQRNHLPPASHPHVARVLASLTSSRGGTGCSKTCVLHVATVSMAERRRFLSTLKVKKREHFWQRCRPLPSKRNMPEVQNPNDLEARMLSRESTPLSILSENALVNSPSRKNILNVPGDYLNNGKDYRRIGTEKGVLRLLSLDHAFKQLEESALGDTVDMPQPFELSEVWVCISRTFSSFQRCSLCLDKLGLSLRPLASAKEIPESEVLLLRGAITRPDDEELVLMTQTMSFPLSSIFEIVTDSKLVRERLRPPPASLNRFSLRMRPFSRSLGPWHLKEQSDEDTGDIEAAETRRPPRLSFSMEPPSPHLLGIRIKGALAGHALIGWGNQYAIPPRVMHNVTGVGSPILVVLSMPAKSDAQELVSRVQAYRLYSMSLLIRSYLSACTRPHMSPMSTQSEESQLGDDAGVHFPIAEEADAGQEPQCVSLASLASPGVLSTSPLEMSSLNVEPVPWMQTTDDGQVVWHFPESPKGSH